MKSRSELLLPYLMVMGMMGTSSGRRRKSVDKNPEYKIIPNGCKEYTIRGVTVIAISEKSAIKKVNKMLSK